MKKVLCALGLALASLSSAYATTYPLTLENCGYKETFTKAPEHVVALGQNTAEILLLLGLEDKIAATAFWPTKVLPQLAEKKCEDQNPDGRDPDPGVGAGANPGFRSRAIAAAAGAGEQSGEARRSRHRRR